MLDRSRRCLVADVDHVWRVTVIYCKVNDGVQWGQRKVTKKMVDSVTLLSLIGSSVIHNVEEGLSSDRVPYRRIDTYLPPLKLALALERFLQSPGTYLSFLVLSYFLQSMYPEKRDSLFGNALLVRTRSSLFQCVAS